MANTQASDLKIDTLYVHEAIDQSAEAYKNLLLLALKNRTDLCRLGSAIDKSMKNYSAGKQLRLHESFRGIAYMSALARENDRSLLRILYMGPKEQKALIRSIVQDISVDQVRDFKMLDPVRKAAEFKVMLYSEEPVSGQSSGPGYLMTFRKRAVNSEEGLSYTLEARFIRGDSDFDDPYFLFREQTLAWEEFTGDLAACIEKIISLSPSPTLKTGSVTESKGIERKNQNIQNSQVANEHKDKASENSNNSFRNVISRLFSGLRGNPPAQDSAKAKQSAPGTASLQNSSSNTMKSEAVNNESEDSKKNTTGNEEKKKGNAYKIIKCKEPVMYHISEKGEPMYLVTSTGDGNDVYITVVVNKTDSIIYIDGGTYDKYKSFIKKKSVLK